MNDNNDNAEASEDIHIVAKPKLELVKPAAIVALAPTPAIIEQKSVQATIEKVFDQRMKGLGAPPAPPPGLPVNIQADWTILTNLQLYLNQVNTDASRLLDDASVLQSLAGSPTAEVQDINKAYATLYTSFGMTPGQQATAIQSAVNDLVTQANTITTQAATIAQMTANDAKSTADVIAYESTLKSQIAALQAQVTVLQHNASTPAAPPVQSTPAASISNTTTFLVGTVAVLGIIGAAWYLSKNRPSESPMPRRLPVTH
jgi:hypothetical protein